MDELPTPPDGHMWDERYPGESATLRYSADNDYIGAVLQTKDTHIARFWGRGNKPGRPLRFSGSFDECVMWLVLMAAMDGD